MSHRLRLSAVDVLVGVLLLEAAKVALVEIYARQQDQFLSLDRACCSDRCR